MAKYSIGSILTLTILPILLIRYTGSVKLVDMLICNTSPLVLLASGTLVMLTDKIPFRSGLINWMASSTLAVYLLTDNGLREKIDPWILTNIKEHEGYGYLLLALVFFTCIAMDKIRGVLFSPLDKIVSKWISKRF